MLDINFEFRKGIFFVRLIGDLTKDTYGLVSEKLEKLILENKFKYIVVNTDRIKRIDFTGLNFINQIYFLIKESESNLIICDKTKILTPFFSEYIPNIVSELEVL